MNGGRQIGVMPSRAQRPDGRARHQAMVGQQPRCDAKQELKGPMASGGGLKAEQWWPSDARCGGRVSGKEVAAVWASGRRWQWRCVWWRCERKKTLGMI
jgi:hypothetical protein